MRSIVSFFLTLTFMQACLSGDDPVVDSTFLYFKTNAFYGMVGSGPFIFSVRRSNELTDVEDLTTQSEIFINGLKSDPTFYPTKEGVYSVSARYKDWTSETFSITVRPYIEYDSISIPIIFHIIEPAEEYITHEDAAYLIERLNLIFQNAYNKNHPNHIASGIFFRLATWDPKGNRISETGIKRYRDGKGYNTIYSFGNQNSWDPSLYFNILVEKSNVISWGVYPPESTKETPVFICAPSSRLVAEDKSWEETYTQFPGYFYGNYLTAFTEFTAAHELGHSFGLQHLHEGCPRDCSLPDIQDYVKTDRFILHDRDFGIRKCNANYWVIPDNLMDYGARVKSFTYDQVKTMRTCLDHRIWIKNLKNSDR